MIRDGHDKTLKGGTLRCMGFRGGDGFLLMWTRVGAVGI